MIYQVARKLRVIASALMLAVCGFGYGATAQDFARGPASIADLTEGLLDAVVNIAISQRVDADEGGEPSPHVEKDAPFQDYFDDFFSQDRKAARKVSSLGSGFVVDPEGYIVTNNHVIEGADEISINFADGSSLEAVLVGTDPKTDLSLLKVEPKAPLAAVKFGNSDNMRIGDWVMAIGNPFGLGGSVSIGIVSARGRNINAGPYDDFIQTDAAINKGNSGGPLFNMEGEVIGVNTAIISPSGGSIGIGFAVPSAIASNVVSQLREFGVARRGWLGVRIQPVPDDLAESLGLKKAHGALVAGILDDGPMANGPLVAGDVILEFNGKSVDKVHDLQRFVAESPTGRDIAVKLWRDEKEVDATVRLALQAGPDDDAVQAEEPEGAVSPEDELLSNDATVELGMELMALGEPERAEFGIDSSVEGVLIVSIEPGSPASKQGIVPGDVIVEVAQEFVDSPEAVSERINRLREQDRRNAQFLLSNKEGDLRFVAIRLD